MNEKTQFQERLIQLRKDEGYTQYSMADMLGLSRSTYSGYESEGKQPDYDCLIKIAACLNTSTDFLLGVSSIPHPNTDVMTNDCINYKKHCDALSPEQRKIADAVFDDFYILVTREMRAANFDKLAIYGELFKQLRSCTAEISLILNASADSYSPDDFARALAVQNDLKSVLSSAVDKLFQAEIKKGK